VITQTCRFAFVVAAVTLLSGLAPCQQNLRAHRKASPSTGQLRKQKLVGSWQPKGGKALVYLSNGTGRNANGSRFNWRLEGDFLVAQAMTSEGKPTGGAARIPILFTRDGKEYSTFAEGGRLKTPFYRLLPNGHVDGHRSKAGGNYLSKRFDPKIQDDDTLPPTVVQPAPARPQPPSPPQKGTKPPNNDFSSTENAPVATNRGGVRVGRNVQVSVALPRASHNEVTIAAHPRDPNCLLAASMLEAPGHPNLAKIIVYTSFDRGKSWTTSLQRNNPDPQSYADPTFACGPDGTIYFADMYFPTSNLGPAQGACVEFTHSANGGKTWSPTTRLDGWHDRPFLAVDTGIGLRQGWIYCSIGSPDRKLFASHDKGQTFLTGEPYSRDPKEQILSGNPVVASDGSLIHLYMSVPGSQIATADPDVRVPGAHSEDPRTGAIMIARSIDGGVSFPPCQKIASFQLRDMRPGGLPMLAADPGSPSYSDRLYAVWADMQPRGTCVMFAVSKDKGVSWSQPILLSEQANKYSYEAFLPSVAVNKAGLAAVSWYDTRAIPLDQAGWDIRMRISRDGGSTWQPSIRVTNVSTLNLKPRRKRSHPETRFNNIQPGHTAGLAADGNGLFHPLWIDGRTGVRQVFTAAISVDDPPTSIR
jgi:hypothetical protein